MALTPVMSHINNYGFLLFLYGAVRVSPVFRWRLSAIKIVLEIELKWTGTLSIRNQLSDETLILTKAE